jgi:outer membrane protein TolC
MAQRSTRRNSLFDGRSVCKSVLILLTPLMLARAEVHSLTLREAVARALKQNPDLVLARLDLMKSQYGITVAKDPFVPKLYGGSGAAWTNGYPTSINGSPPSIFEARTDMSLFNRQQSYGVAQARENARGAEIDVTRQQDEAAYRTASLYLDAQQIAQGLEVARKQISSLEKVQETVRARVAEGRELEIQAKRAALNTAKSQQRVESLEADLETAERNLAVVLGYGAEDLVKTTPSEPRQWTEMPDTEDAATQQAVRNSKEIRLLQSRMQAKTLEIKGYQSSRLPQVAVVAQYNLLARYNFQDFFGRFQPNNGQLGASITIPLLVGSAPKAYIGQNEAELARLRTQMDQLRNRIALDTRKSFLQLRRAETARTVAKLDLDLAREQLSIVLAQYDEGRTALGDVEQARFQENEKWIAYYDAQHMLERVKLDLLRQTGTLMASLE